VTTLLESKARPFGSRKGAALSMVIHGALIAAAVAASGKAVLPPREKIEEHSILYVAPPPPPKVYVAPDPLPEVKKTPAPRSPRPAPPRATPPPQPRTPAPRPTEPQVRVPAAPMIAPVSVPTSIPKVDLNAIPTVNDVPIPGPDPSKVVAAATGRGRASASSDGDVDGEGGRRGGLGSGDANRAFNENQVDRAVQATRPAKPRYPDALKSVNVEGEVMVQYIVDARGRVEPGSIKVLSSAHALFAQAVRTALLEARYRPAEVNGRPVRQLVQQPFRFKLEQQ
jgi:protein TonB